MRSCLQGYATEIDYGASFVYRIGVGLKRATLLLERHDDEWRFGELLARGNEPMNDTRTLFAVERFISEGLMRLRQDRECLLAMNRDGVPVSEEALGIRVQTL